MLQLIENKQRRPALIANFHDISKVVICVHLCSSVVPISPNPLLTFCLLRSIVNHMVKHSTAALDATFGALSDATRRGILAQLALGETSVSDLAAPYDMSLPAVSKHLRVLAEARSEEHTSELQSRP